MKKINVPEGYQSVMPYLILKNALAFFDFTKRVFDAEEKMKYLKDDGSLMHGEIKIGGSTIMVAECNGEYSAQPAGLYIHVANADETYNNALAAGATSIMAPEDKEYGRSGGIKDPFGNSWWITQN